MSNISCFSLKITHIYIQAFDILQKRQRNLVIWIDQKLSFRKSISTWGVSKNNDYIRSRAMSFFGRHLFV